jgi:Txe/YoeB family toxin of Txe-Axe toxin-antitoxin module
MLIKPLRKDLAAYLPKHKLQKKWIKCVWLLENNIHHKSLHVELLEPKSHGIYSFRIDRKYRALFFIDREGRVEIFAITNHYKK